MVRPQMNVARVRSTRLPAVRLNGPGRSPVWLRLAGAMAGVALVAWGQYALGRGAPFQWPLTAWMDRRLDHSFRTDNELAFAIPLFVAGGALFALCATRVAAPALRPWKGHFPLPLPREVILILVLSVAAWAYVNVRLYFNHYDPGYRWAFLWSAVGILSAVLAIDWMRGVIKRPRLTWRLAAEATLVLAIAGTFIGINIRDLASWRYAGIGDEGAFFDFGQRVMSDPDLNWFTQMGVYGQFPVGSSVWHALHMAIFGSGWFGWKMASLATISLTLPLYYWLIRGLLGPRTALFSTLFLGSSHYLFSYAHTGYDNIFPLLPTVASLGLLFAGIRCGSYTLILCSGALAGLGFYTYYSSRAVVGIIALILLTLRQHRWRIDLLLTVGAGFAMTALPIFATDRWDVIDAMFSRSASASQKPLIEMLSGNVPRTLFAFNYNSHNLHYVAGALMDEVTVVLAMAGFFYALRWISNPAYRTLIIWFGAAAAATGFMFQYEYVAISRLHYALPPAAAFAGIAADRAIGSAARLLTTRRGELALSIAAVGALAPVLFILNGKHFFEYSARHNPTTAETVVVREFTDSRCAEQPLRSMAYMLNPDPLLDGVWKFTALKDAKPLQVALRDVDDLYAAYPETGGLGCLAIGDYVAQEAVPLYERLRASAFAGRFDFQIVTDVSGGTKVAFVPPTDGSPGLSPSDLAYAWPRTDPAPSELAGVIQGQERDGILALDDPRFTGADEGRYADREPIVAVEAGGEARAYPIRVLIWHVVVNDTIGGIPAVVTFDPISGSARVFERDLGGSDLTFGVTGLLRGGNSLLYDRQTETWWQQITGEAVAGQLSGATLREIPSNLISWGEFKTVFPEGQVLARPEDSDRYERNPYLGYDVPKGKPIFTAAPADSRLPAMRRVAVIDIRGRKIAVPFPDASVQTNAAYIIDVDGIPVALLFDWPVSSGLDTRNPVDSRSVGALAAYVGEFNGQRLTFEIENGDRIIDQQTRTRWNILGQGVEGPKTGARLEPLPAFQGFWFAVAAAYPGIELVEP